MTPVGPDSLSRMMTAKLHILTENCQYPVQIMLPRCLVVRSIAVGQGLAQAVAVRSPPSAIRTSCQGSHAT